MFTRVTDIQAKSISWIPAEPTARNEHRMLMDLAGLPLLLRPKLSPVREGYNCYGRYLVIGMGF